MNFGPVISRLQKELKKVSQPEVRTWFEDYMKGVIRYRGVKSPVVSAVLKSWRARESLHKLSFDDQFEIACELIRQSFAEDKFAGTLYIQKFLVSEIPLHQMLEDFEDLFEAGCFYDWSTTDWFSVRVLMPLMKLHGTAAHRRISSWHRSDNIWQRRASMVSLRAVVPDAKLRPLIERQMSRLLPSDERFIQTAIGWVLADLAKVDPTLSHVYFRKYLHDLSYEVVRRHSKMLPEHTILKELKRKS